MPEIAQQNIRNFCIIAHIDHGKSTLADRLLETTGTVSHARDAQTSCSTTWTWSASAASRSRPEPWRCTTSAMASTYELNLIDTPGHVDFHYEVSRRLACCEGAMLVVDAFQGVEAQTVANAFAAMDADLTIVPVINKIDLTQRRRRRSAGRDGAFAGDRSRARCSRSARKTGIGIDELLDAVVERVPPPKGDPDAPLQAMVFDSHYDDYRGAITYVRLMNGSVRKGQKIRFLQHGHQSRSAGTGPVRPAAAVRATQLAGRPGRLLDLQHQVARAGAHRRHGQRSRRSGRRSRLPATRSRSGWCIAGCIPSDGQDFEELRDALDKLAINDPELRVRAGNERRAGLRLPLRLPRPVAHGDHPAAAGAGGDVDLVQTAPNVTYEIVTKTARRSRFTARRKCPTRARSKNSASRSCA